MRTFTVRLPRAGVKQATPLPGLLGILTVAAECGQMPGSPLLGRVGCGILGREDEMRTAVALTVVALAGCSREDGERLARVGRLAGEKVRDAAPARTPLGDLHPEATAAGRVRARFRMDAALADQSIQVVEGSDAIHLR